MISPAGTKDAQSALITLGTRLRFRLLDSPSIRSGDMKLDTGLSWTPTSFCNRYVAHLHDLGSNLT